MRIGIFTKIGASGGSEHRAAELASSIVRYSTNACVLLCERNLNPIIRERLDPRVKIVLDVMGPDDGNRSVFSELDVLIVINSDSYSFSKVEYWTGQTPHHPHRIDLSRLRTIVFLYNFVISPSKHLPGLTELARDVRIVCANREYFQEISEKDRFQPVRHLPRLILDSPIDPGTLTVAKTPSDRIRIGKHSKSLRYKFNEQHRLLIERVNAKHGSRIHWDFLGVPGEASETLAGIDNVTLRHEYSIPVGEYLQGIDLFLFFIAWSRNEPWSRAVAEGMMAGCPVLANNRAGNRDQVIHGNTGYLCDTVEDFERNLIHLIESPAIRDQLGKNARRRALQFTSDKVVRQLLDFLAE